MEILRLSALELGNKIKKHEIGVREAAQAVLDRIAETDKIYNAYITVFDDALDYADAIQKKIDAGELSSPLAGVPMAIKDNICVMNKKTTCGSKMLENFLPPYNATVVEKLNHAGAVILGKLNMDEFAMGSTCETSYFGAAKNPWDDSRVPGGSSGGSAAAVALNEAYYTLGSDTGGSIRQPCSYCGVTGLKPTYGAVSRYGLVAYASSLDQIGPIGKNAEDIAAVLDVITGKDDRDSTSVSFDSGKASASLTGDIKGLKIGIPREYFGNGLDGDVKESVLNAAKTLRSLGAEIEEFNLPMVDYYIPAYYIIAAAEAGSNLSRYDGIKYGYRSEKFTDLYDLYLESRSEGFGMEVKRRIMLGNFVLSSGYYDAYYKKALQIKALIKKAYDEAFLKYDMILGPTAPTTAPKLGESLSDPLKMYLTDIYTVSVNLTGLPGLVAPCGFGSNGMPIGVQFIGRHFEENRLLNAAYAFQQATDFHNRVKGAAE
ncbi:MAG: Asp-tRNA(Asn)/Glu-tRNA(Gln) amidotransferase subunit GatA [Clostridia bacterium]|nr:Asp-tRNA(Asn)/Glu-tRNA(Gln) amidotransferase subunit GatA [Clostridia bacterium]